MRGELVVLPVPREEHDLAVTQLCHDQSVARIAVGRGDEAVFSIAEQRVQTRTTDDPDSLSHDGILSGHPEQSYADRAVGKSR